LDIDAEAALLQVERAQGKKKEQLLEVIEKFAKTAFESKNFLKLSAGTLKTLLERDGLAVPEDIVFESVVKWVSAHGGSGKELAKGMAPFVDLIRFPLMTSKDFASKVVPTGALSSAQTLELFTFIAQKESKGLDGATLGSNISKMSKKPRRAGTPKLIEGVQATGGSTQYLSYRYATVLLQDDNYWASERSDARPYIDFRLPRQMFISRVGIRGRGDSQDAGSIQVGVSASESGDYKTVLETTRISPTATMFYVDLPFASLALRVRVTFAPQGGPEHVVVRNIELWGF
jgi:hypothetical protein